MEAYITASSLENFFKVHRMVGENDRENDRKKPLRWNFPKNPLLGQMANFGSIVVQNYASLYLGICAKEKIFFS